MAIKSTLTDLSVVEADPGSTTGVNDITSHFQKYVPARVKTVYLVSCNGDELSVKHMIYATKESEEEQ